MVLHTKEKETSESISESIPIDFRISHVVLSACLGRHPTQQGFGYGTGIPKDIQSTIAMLERDTQTTGIALLARLTHWFQTSLRSICHRPLKVKMTALH